MNRRIFVVDDQEELLETTTAVLRAIDKTWEVTGFKNPLDALNAVREIPPDALITDQMMPERKGSELLEQIRAIAPLTIRIIMSGYLAPETLALITSAHQYLAKPFQLLELKHLIERSFAAQKRIVNDELQVVVGSIRAIPSLPHIHHSLVAKLKDDESPTEGIARLIGADPGITAKVLQLANSPLFGRSFVVTEVMEAVNCLGTELITAVILSQSVFQKYEGIKVQEVDPGRVWSHSWETACLAQHICREQGLSRQQGDEAFLAGLLHEVGRFVLLDNFTEQYRNAYEAAVHDQIPLPAQLREVFQTTPTRLSAYVLELWGLPASAVNGIFFMDNPENDPEPEFSVSSALYIAHHLASRTFAPDSSVPEELNLNYLKAIGCEESIHEWQNATVT